MCQKCGMKQSLAARGILGGPLGQFCFGCAIVTFPPLREVLQALGILK